MLLKYNKILKNLLITKFCIKNCFELPQIKKSKVTVSLPPKLKYFVPIIFSLFFNKIPKPIFSKNWKNKHFISHLEFTLSSKETYFILLKFIFFILIDIPTLKKYKPTVCQNNWAILHFNKINLLPEIKDLSNKNQIPFILNSIKFNWHIFFNTKNKKLNQFLLKSLKIPM